MYRECFEEPSDRLGFIRKVYGILSVQLSFTAVFCFIVMNSPALAAVVLNLPLLITVVVMYLMSACALMCCGLDKKVPVNYLILAVFTFCVSWIVSTACIRYDQATVFSAAVLTSAVVIGLTLYAMFTKTDFTLCGGALYSLGMILLAGAVLSVFYGPSMNLLYSVFGVFLFSFYLVYDTQLLIGSKSKNHKRYQIEADSYILASVLLYLDIINLFLEILAMFGKK